MMGIKKIVDQKSLFIKKEADNWYERNKEKFNELTEKDLVLNYIKGNFKTPKNFLEIGCSDGWRLNELSKMFNCPCFGVEPSRKAIREGKKKYKNIKLLQGTADEIPIENYSFENVIIGFCLYLCDREDLFKIAYEIDRLLSDRGNLLIYDFYSEIPYKNKYTHLEGLFSYKMDYSKLFTCNPNYNLVYKEITSHDGIYKDDPNEKIALTVLRKCKENSFVDNPYK